MSGKDPITLTMILQDMGGALEAGGLLSAAGRQIGGHDGAVVSDAKRASTRPRAKHNAWFYYLTAMGLTAPVNFMSTPQLDKLAEEMQSARPGDLPA